MKDVHCISILSFHFASRLNGAWVQYCYLLFLRFLNRPNGRLLEIEQSYSLFSRQESNTSFKLLAICDLHYVAFQSLHCPVHRILSHTAAINIQLIIRREDGLKLELKLNNTAVFY